MSETSSSWRCRKLAYRRLQHSLISATFSERIFFWKASKVSHVTDELVMGERTGIRTGRRVQFVWGCWVITSWSRKGPRLDKKRKRKVMAEALLFLYKVSCSCSGQYWDRRSYGARISFVIIFYLCCVMRMLL